MKVVINKCYGGFGLSDKAFKLYLKKKGKKFVEKDGGCYYTISKKEYDKISKESDAKDGDYRNVNNKGYILIDTDIQRDDKILIEVVKELGKEANGQFAELELVEIPDDIEWNIDEYDGIETIHEEHRSW